MTKLERQSRKADRAQFKADVLMGRILMLQPRLLRATRLAAVEQERYEVMQAKEASTPPPKTKRLTTPQT